MSFAVSAMPLHPSNTIAVLEIASVMLPLLKFKKTFATIYVCATYPEFSYAMVKKIGRRKYEKF
jgi:hypothetical protein